MNTNVLKKIIRSGEIAEAERCIRSIVEEKRYDYIPLFIEEIELTENATLRNRLALALADLHINEAIAPLVRLVNLPRTIGNRGTLIYVLSHLDCQHKLVELIPFLGDTSYEVRMESYALLKAKIEEASPEIKILCSEAIKARMEHLEEEYEMLEEVQERISIDSERDNERSIHNG